ncbi:MAG: thiamine-phosphate kinase [Candidatus Saganbacteria bacterium]|nr:thiamine-phosphate kinase [Candidatus Saganbacteria bacterium]
MKLSQLGEFGLIELIARRESKRRGTVVGIGDDAAVLQLPTSNLQPQNKNKSQYQLITTDALIEGVHFKRKGLSFFALGGKALAANISDIAAMGGLPKHALVTLGLPKNLPVKAVGEFYRGLNRLARKYNIDVIGGDTAASPRAIIVSLTLLGRVEKKNILLRSTARPGDLICVTGRFGGPASRKFEIRNSKFEIRLEEARAIARSGLATAMIDSSDGLARSVIELCRASRTGARLWEIEVPVAPGATVEQALGGGEEYELVFTAGKNKIEKLHRGGLKFRVVGEIVAPQFGLKLFDRRGRIRELKTGGYEHFVK